MCESEKSCDSLMVERTLFQVGDGGSIPTSPLQLKVERINVHLACKMNEEWHSRLPRIHWSNVARNTHYVCYGASYDYRWYAVGIWSSPVARLLDNKSILELRRLAICRDAPKNTASRMICVMVKLIRKRLPQITKLISYQDTAVHNGTIYKASGWRVGGILVCLVFFLKLFVQRRAPRLAKGAQGNICVYIRIRIACNLKC